MIRNLTLAFCTVCSILVSGRAQDIHFTLYDIMPLAFNPAESGAFSGTYRLAAIYRDQWLSVTGIPNEYKTPALSLDVPVVKGLRDNDWVGVGVLLYADKSGSLGLSQTAFKLSAAYHFALDKRGNNILSLGYQTGSVQRKLDGFTLMSATQDPNNNNPDLLEDDPGLINELQSSYTDHVGGLHLKALVNREDVLQLGVSVGHLGRSEGGLRAMGGGADTLGPSGNYQIPERILAHGSYRTMMNDRLAIIPSAFVQVLGKDSEIMGQVVGEYLFNPEKEVVLKGGVGYRVGDAIQLILGVDIRELKVTFGYDINVSQLTPASNTLGAIELSASIIGIIYKRPDPDPVLFCPRF